MTVPSTATLGGAYFLWTLLLSNAVVLAALLFVLWRLQRVRRFVDVCAWAETITVGHKSISLGHYLVRRFNIRVTHGLSRAEAATLKADLASLSIEGKVATRVLGRHGTAMREPRNPPTASRPSALDEFPEEQGLPRRV
jgi:hypothetical protein